MDNIDDETKEKCVTNKVHIRVFYFGLALLGLCRKSRTVFSIVYIVYSNQRSGIYKSIIFGVADFSVFQILLIFTK